MACDVLQSWRFFLVSAVALCIEPTLIIISLFLPNTLSLFSMHSSTDAAALAFHFAKKLGYVKPCLQIPHGYRLFMWDMEYLCTLTLMFVFLL